MATCIENVVNGRPQPFTIKMENYHQQYHDSHIADVMKAQQNIGWSHLPHGLLATAWQELAAINMLNPTKLEYPQGHHRIQLILKALHLFTRTLWLERNNALHTNGKDKADAKVYSAESAELRHYHSDPNLLKVQDQHYCISALSLDKLLQSQPSVRRRWLRQVRTPARALFVKEGNPNR